MAFRYARTDTLGLVVAPLDTDCVGPECRVALQKGRCFIDEHHLYFSEANFARRSLSREFRKHPLNQINVPRCRHDQYHTQVDSARIPDDDVMATFLDEAEILRQLGVVTREVLCLEKRLDCTDSRDLVRITWSDGGPKGFEELLERHKSTQTNYLEQAAKLEIIPERLLFAAHVVGASAIWGTRAA